jgi:hypothetical protein
MPALDPTTVRVLSPNGVLLEVPMFIVTAPVVDMVDDGTKLTVAPVGRPSTLKDSRLLNPNSPTAPTL